MQRSVDLFIAGEESLADLAASIRGRSELAVVERPDLGVWEVSDGDLTAQLHEHAFIDDDELPLTRYRYALSLHTATGGHLGTSAETSMLRRIAEDLDDHRVLLVLDLQYRDDPTGVGS